MNEKSIIYGTSLQKILQFFTTVGAMGRLITAVDATGFNGSVTDTGRIVPKHSDHLTTLEPHNSTQMYRVAERKMATSSVQLQLLL